MKEEEEERGYGSWCRRRGGGCGVVDLLEMIEWTRTSALVARAMAHPSII
jgi:hypothetical protein